MDLYTLPTLSEPAAQQHLETEFFQKIDDRAAIALDKLDRAERGTAAERLAFAQFALSLVYRTPGNLARMRDELRQRVLSDWKGDFDEAEFERELKSQTNELLAMLVESPDATQRLAELRMFAIPTTRSKFHLITSDRPTMLGAQLVGPEAFLMFPYAPDKLAILANSERVAAAFARQTPNALVRGVNDAVVRQAEVMVVASSAHSEAFINRRFLKPQTWSDAVDNNGMVRWKVP